MIRTFRLNKQAVIEKYAKQFKRDPESCKAFLDEVCGKDMFNIIIQHTAETTEQQKRDQKTAISTILNYSIKGAVNFLTDRISQTPLSQKNAKITLETVIDFIFPTIRAEDSLAVGTLDAPGDELASVKVAKTETTGRWIDGKNIDGKINNKKKEKYKQDLEGLPHEDYPFIIQELLKLVMLDPSFDNVRDTVEELYGDETLADEEMLPSPQGLVMSPQLRSQEKEWLQKKNFYFSDVDFNDYKKKVCGAVLTNPESLNSVNRLLFRAEDYKTIVKDAVTKHSDALKYVDSIDFDDEDYEEIAIAAVTQNHEALKHVDKEHSNYIGIVKEAVTKHPDALKHVDSTMLEPDDYIDIVMSAIKANYGALQYVDTHHSDYTDIVMTAASIDPIVLEHIDSNKLDYNAYKEIILNTILNKAALTMDEAALTMDKNALEDLEHNIKATIEVCDNLKDNNLLMKICHYLCTPIDPKETFSDRLSKFSKDKLGLSKSEYESLKNYDLKKIQWGVMVSGDHKYLSAHSKQIDEQYRYIAHLSIEEYRQIVKMAVSKDPKALLSVNEQNFNPADYKTIAEVAVTANHEALRYVDRTKLEKGVYIEMVKDAVSDNSEAIKYVSGNYNSSKDTYEEIVIAAAAASEDQAVLKIPKIIQSFTDVNFKKIKRIVTAQVRREQSVSGASEIANKITAANDAANDVTKTTSAQTTNADKDNITPSR